MHGLVSIRAFQKQQQFLEKNRVRAVGCVGVGGQEGWRVEKGDGVQVWRGQRDVGSWMLACRSLACFHMLSLLLLRSIFPLDISK